MRKWTTTGWSAMAGAIASCILAVQFTFARGPVGLIELIFLLAPLVAVPLGLALAAPTMEQGRAAQLLRLASICQPLAAMLTVFAFLQSPGRTAAILSASWALVCAVAGLAGLLSIFAGAWRRLDALCASVGLMYLPVGGIWLVLSRARIAPTGYAEPIVLLTAMHFHYAGFCAALITGATTAAFRRVAPRGNGVMCLAATGVLTGPALVAIGFVVSLPFKVAMVYWFSLSLLAVAAFSFIVQWEIGGLARLLLFLSSASAIGGELLAPVWALGELTGRIWVDLAHMAQTHGVLNGPGFALCGLLGWVLSDPGTEIRR